MTALATTLRRAVRHRLAPLLLVAILALLAARTCQSESVEATLEVRFGAAASEVREVRGELSRPDESRAVGYFGRTYGEGGAPGPLRWPLQAAPGSYELDVEVELEGRRVDVQRRVELVDRSVITVDLERDLAKSADSG